MRLHFTTVPTSAGSFTPPSLQACYVTTFQPNSWLSCPKRLWLEVHAPPARRFRPQTASFTVGNCVRLAPQPGDRPAKRTVDLMMPGCQTWRGTQACWRPQPIEAGFAAQQYGVCRRCCPLAGGCIGLAHGGGQVRHQRDCYRDDGAIQASWHARPVPPSVAPSTSTAAGSPGGVTTGAVQERPDLEGHLTRARSAPMTPAR
jgi:hypothetical protein